MKNISVLRVSIFALLLLAMLIVFLPSRPLVAQAINAIAFTRSDEVQVFAARLSISRSLGMGELRRFEGLKAESWLEALKTRQSVGMGELHRFEGQAAVSFLETLKTRQSLGIGELRRFEAQQIVP